MGPHRMEPIRSLTRAAVAVVLLGSAACGTTGTTQDTPRSASGQVQPAGTTIGYSFEDGALPDGSQPFAGDWLVRAQPGSPSPKGSLCQTGTAEFPAIALGPQVWRDVTISMRFEAISGNEDQAAGIIARVIDSDNYYLLRANALEDNVNLYAYVDGERTTVAEGAGDLAPGEWHQLRLEVVGDKLTGFLDGEQVVTATSTRFATGRIGMWTKADSVTCFDDVKATAR